MDLIDRYLHAIRRNLPADKSDDIVAELREDLLSRKEDREERLGRALDKRETEALIKDFGHPLVIASRYRTHQYLIGPESFPFYVAVMRIVLLIVVAIGVAVGVAHALFGSENWVQAMAQTFSGLWASVLLNAAIITLVFAVLDRTGFAAEHVMKWVPNNLPDIADKQPGPWESAFEVALGIAFLLWWTNVIQLPIITQAGDQFRMTPDPAFQAYYWPILVLVSARLVHSLVQWLRPRWRLVRATLSVATAAGGLALLAMLYRAGHWATITPLHMSAEDAAKLDTAVNLGLKIAIITVGVAWTFNCLGELWRLFRTKR